MPTHTDTVQPVQMALQVRDYLGQDGCSLRYGYLENPNNPATGQPLLFIPGLGGSVKGALDFLSLLLNRYSPIYAPDLRGFGLNPVSTRTRDPQHHRQDLTAFWETVLAPSLSENDPLTLCGISLGGALATILSTENPQRYAQQVLLVPAYKAVGKTFNLPYQLKSVWQRLLHGKNHTVRLPYGTSELTRNSTILEDPEYQNREPLQIPVDYLLALRPLCQEAFLAAKQISVPTMMVVAEADVVCDPVAMRQAYEWIPENTTKQYHTYPGVYHDVLFEPEYVDIAHKVLDWHP